MLSIFAGLSSRFSLICHWVGAQWHIVVYIRNVHGQLLRQCLSWWPPVQIVGFGYRWLRTIPIRITLSTESTSQWLSTVKGIHSSPLLGISLVLWSPVCSLYASLHFQFDQVILSFLLTSVRFSPQSNTWSLSQKWKKKLPIDLTHAIYPI